MFIRALSAVVERIRGLTQMGEMVAWNEVALAFGNDIVAGYPFGPTNLPMYGKMLRDHKCSGPCRHKWLNQTVGMYW